ncbi:NAD-dependent epimerase/dehydratase [Chloroherpeton thalassium ATCC 35110]|uniref:NAD-dependent epimerase/dehydratase n=1 Tax=Chloroherpeton thalassium (strain ATCC 35110 / GB-78) TaxID=517418 RepID=B3QSD7_CHLT3|nr:NAD-dependent epimerase/dehydratase family protein [Chloroherpeton thalassium]ACF12528.1 NAD-dependent epimerase/dehydratase [Chloroherpeton thalassium ATCC 35110]
MPDIKILVTGATGYIGSALVLAIHRKYGKQVQIKALVRKNSPRHVLKGVPVEFIDGDVTVPLSLWEATKNVDVVFHTAALVSYQQRDRRKLYKINVLGTRHLVDACLRNQVKKLIHTSSVAAVGVIESGALNPESQAFEPWQHRYGYMAAKYLSELEVLRGTFEGLHTVMVNPGAVMGSYPGSLYPVNSASSFIEDIYKGLIPFYPTGGVGFVDISDVVTAHLLAWERGENGERYNIVSENLTYKALFDLTTRVPGSRSRTAEPLNKWFGRVLGMGTEVMASVMRRTSTVTFDGVRLAELALYFDNSKSKQALGLKYRPFVETVLDLLRASQATKPFLHKA